MKISERFIALSRSIFGTSLFRLLGYLGLCAAYLQGGINKLLDFPAAVAEMVHFGLTPAPVFAVLVIILELSCSVMILLGYYRWLAALALGGFTLLASLLALRFWELPQGIERFSATNAFFEHLGLLGGMMLIAWLDLQKNPLYPSSMKLQQGGK